MDSPTARPQMVAQAEMNWDKSGLFSGIIVALYPVSVVKTRLQVASKNAAHQNAVSVIRNILRSDGVLGLYRGFGIIITGGVPTRVIFMTTLETTKVATLKRIEPLQLSQASQVAIANGVAGMTASLSSQVVFVPIDVISQKLMMQGYSGHGTYNGGLDVARKLIRVDGIRGLYKGFGLSVMRYAPTSAVWWASYGSSQRQFWRLLSIGYEHKGAVTSKWTIVGVQAAGGVIAGVTASCFTTPLDTVQTRLQVTEHERKQGAVQVVRELVREEGWREAFGLDVLYCNIKWLREH
ncbi:hypothetical protein V2J09_003446 [Rumex salicifolius]